MTAEAAFSTTAKDSAGNLHTIRGDNYDEFAGNILRALGQEAGERYLATFTFAFGGTPQATAVANLQSAGVVAGAPAVTAPVSTVGQPLPQPGTVAQPAAPVAAPPTVQHPGNCAHGGPYVYVDKPARGKPWRRFECSVPWSKDATGRCKPINVEG